MRVLMVFDNYSDSKVSGEFIAAQLNISQLRKEKVDCKILYTQDIVSTKKNYLNVLTSLFFSVKSFFAMSREISLFTPDVVHFHNVTPFLSPSVFLAAKLRSCKVVHTLHHSRWLCIEGSFYLNGSYCEKCMINRYSGIRNNCSKNSKLASILMTLNNILWIKSGLIHKLVDKYIAVSLFTKSKHIALGFPSSKISVFGHWSHYTPSMSMGFESRDIDILFIGRVSIAKGINIVIDLAKYSRYNIYVCGDGPDMDTLKSFNYLENLHIMGMLDHDIALHYLSRAKLLIMPSICSESFGLSAAEAVAHGTPMLVSNKGALPEIATAAKSGHVISDNSYYEYLRLADTIISNPDSWNSLHNNALKFSNNTMLEECNSTRLLSIYGSMGVRLDNSI